MREHTNAWGTMQVAKSATQEMQDCQEEQEEEVQEDRRCNKARIFARMLKARRLPADIAALYQDATEKLGKPARAFSHLAHQPPAPKELKKEDWFWLPPTKNSSAGKKVKTNRLHIHVLFLPEAHSESRVQVATCKNTVQPSMNFWNV